MQSSWGLFPTKQFQKYSQRGFAFDARDKLSGRSLVDIGTERWLRTLSSR